MKVFVLGGDGFCGWPTSLHLSNLGHDVVILDNLSRRNIDNELEAGSLTPIQSMGVRLSTWKSVTGNAIEFENIDIAQEYDHFLALMHHYKPDAIVHFAEQRAAPYSMKSARHKRHRRQQLECDPQHSMRHCGIGSRCPFATPRHHGCLWLWHSRDQNS